MCHHGSGRDVRRLPLPLSKSGHGIPLWIELSTMTGRTTLLDTQYPLVHTRRRLKARRVDPTWYWVSAECYDGMDDVD